MAGNPIIGRINNTLRRESTGPQTYGQPGGGFQQYPPQGQYGQGGQPQQGQQAFQGGAQPGWNATQGATGGYAQQQSMTNEQLQDMYRRPAAGPMDTGRLTMDDVIMKSLVLFGITVGVAAASWVVTSNTPSLTMPLWMGGVVITLVLGFVLAFMRTVMVPLYLVYAVAQGAFVGAFSQAVNNIEGYEGVVPTAVLATLCTFGAMYLGYATGLIRVTSRMRRIFVMVVMGYALFSLVQLVLLLTHVIDGWGFGGSGPFGIIASVVGVGLAAFSLAFDFDSIQQGVSTGAPRKFAWLLAHGLVTSVVWLYVEFVRLFARLRD